MSSEQHERVRSTGFVAALDQSGGSTPKALEAYGIGHDAYADDAAMFDLMHAMRVRIITSPSFTAEHVFGVILFEDTLDRQIEGRPAASYLWQDKGMVPFLKVDQGLAEQSDGVQLMKDLPDLAPLLGKAREAGVFGTKMRSVVHDSDAGGIAAVLDQQFSVAAKILSAGLVPILEPEVSIESPHKADAEEQLRKGLEQRLADLTAGQQVMLKLTIPTADDLYAPLAADPRVLRVLALSGGYSRDDACARLARSPSMTASFSRALTEGLTADQSAEEFDATLDAAIREIYTAAGTGVS